MEPMVANNANRKSRVGRAGWLFADLSIILMIIFASTAIKADSPRCDEKDLQGTTCPSTTTTDVPPPPGGFRPDPLQFSIPGASKMSSASLFNALERRVQKAITDSKSDGIKRLNDDVYFGVILIYGGTKGVANSVGDRNAIRAQNLLSPKDAKQDQLWARIRPFTYFTTGHQSDLDPGQLMFRLFPVIEEEK